MVSLWPWKGEDSSPAAFEKTLSVLSNKIGRATSNLERTRQSGRRYKALWTLYTSFAYLLYVMIGMLVIGWRNWGAVEYTVVSSAPVLIYSIRLALDSIYDYRANKQRVYLQSLQKQRDDTISKLKEATKYNTTQQLLEKYGGMPPKPAQKQKHEGESNKQNPVNVKKRRETTAFVPPSTANIPGRRVVTMSSSSTPQPSGAEQPRMQDQAQNRQDEIAGTRAWQRTPKNDDTANAEFAPNAFNESRVYVTNHEGSKWYDRVLDIVLGEDEASPKNRLALICRECRLVNGLAPPGFKALEAVGKWRCSACGVTNGEDQEAKNIVQSLAGQADEASSSSKQEGAALQEANHEEEESSDQTVYYEDEAGQAVQHSM